MDNNKKPSEPLAAERWEKEIGRLIRVINSIEAELITSIWTKFLISLILSGTALAISIFTFLRL